MDEKWNGCARTGIASYVFVHWREAEGSGKEKLIVILAKLFLGQCLEDMVRRSMRTQTCKSLHGEREEHEIARLILHVCFS